MRKKVLVIGGGASGIMAAIQAARKGADVTIYEKNDRIGKKILATGNGKCNLSNRNMNMDCYYTEDRKKLEACFQCFSVEDTIAFFKEYGLLIREKDGYLYPYCEQASAVLDILRHALEIEEVKVITDVTDIAFLSDKKSRFCIQSSKGKEKFDAVILACGSKAGIKNADTSALNLAKQFGHRIISLQPALVQVRCEGNMWKMVAGVRCKARISLICDGREEATEYGELQLTDYGISGIPVFQISRLIARMLETKRKVEVIIDFLPEYTKEEWKRFCSNRLQKVNGGTCEEFLTGILHKKITQMLLKKYGIAFDAPLTASNQHKIKKLCDEMKEFMVVPKEMNPFENAQVCCGGVDFMELDENMQSIYQKDLYICGEMVDIDGKCGGYNLQWAWTSGYIAGKAATDSDFV